MVCIPSRLIVERARRERARPRRSSVSSRWRGGATAASSAALVSRKGYQPVRIALGVYAFVTVLTYIIAFTSRFTFLDEMNNADRP